jgi:protein CpxP
MKRIAYQLTRSTALIAAVAVLVICMVLISAGPSSAAPKKPGHTMGAKALTADHVEARIKYLHSSLNITPEQETLWNNVTQVMLDNAKTMEELIKVRAEAAATVTPIDDLKSYSAIADGHADGLKKFIPAFEALYAGMSEEQQKNAHKLFHDRRNQKSKAKSK